MLIEDEFGHINMIVKPKVYQRCRAAVRMEPFLLVRGRLQKDGATLNAIADQVRALEVEDAPGDAGAGEGAGSQGAGHARAGRDGAGSPHASLPDPLEYWPDPMRRRSEATDHDGSTPAPMDLLTHLRQVPPEARSWG
ncbi:MAG: hypothetical protein ACOCUZ_02730 [bacterium]